MIASSMRTRSLVLLSVPLVFAQLVFAQPPNMQAIAQALGVSCNYCHVAERGGATPEPKKDIARAMMAMTRDINAKVQAATGLPAGKAVEVQCITCHHGVPIPKQLSEILTQTVREKGAPRQPWSSIASYASNSTDGRLTISAKIRYIALAHALSQSRPADSIALLELNLEFYPRSAASYAEIGFRVHAQAGRRFRYRESGEGPGDRAKQWSDPRATGAVEVVPASPPAQINVKLVLDQFEMIHTCAHPLWKGSIPNRLIETGGMSLQDLDGEISRGEALERLRERIPEVMSDEQHEYLHGLRRRPLINWSRAEGCSGESYLAAGAKLLGRR